MLIEHNENKIIKNVEDEVGPGVLKSSVQQTSPCKNTRQQRQNRNIAFGLLAAGTFVEHWALQVQSRLETSQTA